MSSLERFRRTEIAGLVYDALLFSGLRPGTLGTLLLGRHDSLPGDKIRGDPVAPRFLKLLQRRIKSTGSSWFSNQLERGFNESDVYDLGESLRYIDKHIAHTEHSMLGASCLRCAQFLDILVGDWVPNHDTPPDLNLDWLIAEFWKSEIEEELIMARLNPRMRGRELIDELQHKWYSKRWEDPAENLWKSIWFRSLKALAGLFGDYDIERALIEETLANNSFGWITENLSTIAEQKNRPQERRLYEWLYAFFRAGVRWKLASYSHHGKKASKLGEFKVLVRAYNELFEIGINSGVWSPLASPKARSQLLNMVYAMHHKMLADILHDALKRLEISLRWVSSNLPRIGVPVAESELRQMIKMTNQGALVHRLCAHLVHTYNSPSTVRLFWFDTLLRIGSLFMSESERASMMMEVNALVQLGPRSADRKTGFGYILSAGDPIGPTAREYFANSDGRRERVHLMLSHWLFNGRVVAASAPSFNEFDRSCVALEAEIVEDARILKLGHALENYEGYSVYLEADSMDEERVRRYTSRLHWHHYSLSRLL